MSQQTLGQLSVAIIKRDVLCYSIDVLQYSHLSYRQMMM